MKIVILGAKGQVGCALTALSIQRGIQIRALAHEQADITDGALIGEILANEAPQIVINAAGYTNVDEAESNASPAFRVNCEGAAKVAAACARLRLPLLHLSTDYVFDGQKAGLYIEADRVCPVNMYGRSKEAGERAIRQNLAQHIILRTGWVFGPDGHNFLKTMIRLAQTKEKWSVVGDQVGTPTSTADLAIAILAVAERAVDGEKCWGLYHFAGSDETTWHDFACEIVTAQASATGRRPAIRRISTAEYATPARRPANSRLDSSLFTERFNVQALPLRERMRQAVASILGD